MSPLVDDGRAGLANPQPPTILPDDVAACGPSLFDRSNEPSFVRRAGLSVADKSDATWAQYAQDLAQRQALFQEISQSVDEHEIDNTVSIGKPLIAAEFHRCAAVEPL